jgi:adenosylcobinamide kinase/adenosylcobinamide-phosphate guanylyltransferase
MTYELTLILGGARSGKSRYAEQVAPRLGRRVLYVATAQAGDAEMAARISAHQAARPAGWTTLEADLRPGDAIQRLGAEFEVVLLDCLTLLAANVVGRLSEPVEQAAADAALTAEVDGLLAAYQARPAHYLVISNEVGLGVVPPYPLGRVYRDALGRANQRLAAAADNVLFMVAGLPLVVKGRLPDATASA